MLLTCPEPQTLRQLVTGQLDDSQSQPLEEHLSQCPHCVALLEESPNEDPLERDVRDWVRYDNRDELDPPMHQLIEQLRQLRPRLVWHPSSGLLRRDLGEPDPVPAIEPPPEIPDLPGVPKTGRYRPIRLLGEGGTGSVYLAYDPDLRRPVAVKIPHFDLPDEARNAAHRCFEEEARLAASLHHPNVCEIYDVGQDDGVPYIVMQYIEGCSLADRLQESGRMTNSREVATLAIQMADGLTAVHAAKLIHRDLKPGNILLDTAGQALLTDFGLAGRGTPAYMAPEQLTSALGPITPQTDLYSLGVVLYQMLTGRLPFETLDRNQLLAQIVNDIPPKPRSLQPTLDPTLEAIVVRAMEKRPEERYRTAGELSQALRVWMRRQDKRPFPLRWMALGATLVVLVMAFLGVSQGGSADTLVMLGLDGWLDVKIRDREDPDNAQPMPLNQPGVLPLRRTDEVLVEAQLTRPAYLYLIWIDSVGKPSPIYPWLKLRWDRRPRDEQRSTHLQLPPPNTAWPMKKGPPGPECLVLLVRETPLPNGDRLDRALTGQLPIVAYQPQSVAWFRDWSLVTNEMERTPILGEIQDDRHPYLYLQERIKERLSKYAHFSRTIVFAYSGK